ncbi:MAG: hypothetical protein HY302_12910 [Opitutae bacterium]|nr:hypothetical protein [Opitutae bacterium]
MKVTTPVLVRAAAWAVFLGSAVRLTAAEPAGAAAPTAKAPEYAPVGFDQLASFNFVPPDTETGPTPAATSAKSNEQIPERIRAYDRQQVAVTGFMLPVKMDGGLVKEFLLVKDPMLCCYGVMPKVTEWVVVKMGGAGVKPLMDTPLTFLGKLRVGEIMENGYLTGIYLLEGERQG